MFTFKQILDHIMGKKKIRMVEGSCFGVTDPSRLRPAFNERKKDVAKSDESKGRTVRIDTDKVMKDLKGGQEMEVVLNEDLAGCRVEMWFKLSLSTGETGSEVAGYFTDRDLATEKGRGKGWFGADGYVEPIFVLTRDGKTGYLVGKEVALDDESKTIESVRERALKKLTAEEIRILGLDKGSVKSINTEQKCSCGFEECPHCGDDY